MKWLIALQSCKFFTFYFSQDFFFMFWIMNSLFFSSLLFNIESAIACICSSNKKKGLTNNQHHYIEEMNQCICKDRSSSFTLCILLLLKFDRLTPLLSPVYSTLIWDNLAAHQLRLWWNCLKTILLQKKRERKFVKYSEKKRSNE